MSTARGRLSRLVSVVPLALSLGACAVNDEIDSQVDRLERNVQGAKDDGIFKNIIRAAEDRPLDFTTVQALHGSNSITSTL